ncbi:MAG: HAD-IIIA family hydrolase [Lentimicrobiaceae bacterium]|nr:HAD-IIIA family hydrolase [Lentimicrobiaceae bacterium]
MKTCAVILAPQLYEQAFIRPLKGIPFFLFSAIKVASCIGKENVIVLTGSEIIAVRCNDYGFKTLITNDISDENLPRSLFSSQPGCIITLYAGMPCVTVESIQKGISMAVSDRKKVTASVSSFGFNAENPLLVEENAIELPLSFTPTGEYNLSGFLLLSPPEAQVFTNVTDVEKFASSDEGINFFKTVSPEVVRLMHPHTIKMLLLDVDGVLTDGGMYYTENGDEFKKFDTKDGLAIKSLVKKGFTVGFISAGKNHNLIESRAKLLGAQYCYVGFTPKKEIVDGWLKELQLQYENVMYVGDDLVDLEIFDAGALSVCPADAVKAIKNKAKIILEKKGGEGCVRELVDNYLG